MGKTNTSKIKLLVLLEILKSKTDEEHPLGVPELIEQLEKQEIFAERKSLYRDLEVLKEAGFDVMYTRTPKSGYYLGERELQLAEIRLLMDGVLSAGFITPKKSKELMEKLCCSLSEHQTKKLSSQVYLDRRNKQANEEIYYTVDTLHRAIDLKQKVTFLYGRRVMDEQGKVVLSTKRFRVSPYALLWEDDRYYLIGNNEKYNNLMHLRVDRMQRAELLPEPARNFEEVCEYRNFFDVADYGGKLSNAFAGNPVTATLRCREDLLEFMLDRFGKSVSLYPAEEGYFTLRVPLAMSEGLVHDILNFGEGVEVISPKELRQKVADTVEALHKMYAASLEKEENQ